MAKNKSSSIEKREEKISLKKQFKENKQLLIGVSVAILMLILASLGAKGDFLKEKRESKPVPEELTKRLTPTPTETLNTNSGECIVTGCSGQICANEEVVTTCEFKEIYSCYETAVCEVQDNGECGWTMDEELKGCLQSYVSEPSI